MKKLITIIACTLGLTAALAATPRDMKWLPHHEIASTVMQIKTPMVLAEKKGHDVTAVFMQLNNHGKFRHSIVAAYSPIAQRIQLHRTTKNGGMRQVKHIVIKKHGETDLHMGAMHVMLIHTYHELHAGEIVPVTLIFADGSHMTLHALVKA